MKYFKLFLITVFSVCVLLAMWNEIHMSNEYYHLNSFLMPNKFKMLMQGAFILFLYLMGIFVVIKQYKFSALFVAIYCFSSWYTAFNTFLEPIGFTQKLIQTFHQNLPPYSYVLVMFLSGCCSLALFLIKVYESHSKKKIADASA